MHTVEEQSETISELEEECRTHKATIAELRNSIRKMELTQFEMTEATLQQARASRQQETPNHDEVTRKLHARLQELEATLKREREERSKEQASYSERIASLEADLTLAKGKQHTKT
jgi:predicted negative regulator of RcsB-dependent stress response